MSILNKLTHYCFRYPKYTDNEGKNILNILNISIVFINKSNLHLFACLFSFFAGSILANRQPRDHLYLGNGIQSSYNLKLLSKNLEDYTYGQFTKVISKSNLKLLWHNISA